MSSASWIIFGVLFGFYIGRLFSVLLMYTDDFWLIEKSVNEDPGAWYCWFVRGHKQFQQQCIRGALNSWVMAKILSPHEYKVLFNLGILLKFLKQDAEAEKQMEEARKHIVKGQEKTAEHLDKAYKDGKYQLLR